MRLFGLIILLCLSAGNSLVGQKRTYTSSRDTTVKLLSDDPIAAALDSLAYLKLFESTRFGSEFGRATSMGFSPDSVPVYDASVIADRIAKLDA